ncbi:MAG: hypothetical protein AAFV93_01075 [Chloroflexota bacterium]
MQIVFFTIVSLSVIGVLYAWYHYEVVLETTATVHLQSEHEHFHFIVDLPDHLKIQAGDTLHILQVPDLENGRTESGEMSYESPVRLTKASWLQRHLIRSSSMVEVAELLDDV